MFYVRPFIGNALAPCTHTESTPQHSRQSTRKKKRSRSIQNWQNSAVMAMSKWMGHKKGKPKQESWIATQRSTPVQWIILLQFCRSIRVLNPTKNGRREKERESNFLRFRLCLFYILFEFLVKSVAERQDRRVSTPARPFKPVDSTKRMKIHSLRRPMRFRIPWLPTTESLHLTTLPRARVCRHSAESWPAKHSCRNRIRIDFVVRFVQDVDVALYIFAKSFGGNMIRSNRLLCPLWHLNILPQILIQATNAIFFALANRFYIEQRTAAQNQISFLRLFAPISFLHPSESRSDVSCS